MIHLKQVINDGHRADEGESGSRRPSRPSAMELVTPADGRRTLWCELPEVIESGLLSMYSASLSYNLTYS